jgi:CheY-like chemotaxis protein
MSASRRRPRVLVVEDDAALRDLIALRLRLLGIETTAAGSVPEAIAALEVTSVDIVLSDYSLPGPTGLALLAYIHGSRPLVPFILMSAALDPELHARALAEGADAVYDKRDLLPLLPQVFERFPAAA